MLDPVDTGTKSRPMLVSMRGKKKRTRRAAKKAVRIARPSLGPTRPRIVQQTTTFRSIERGVLRDGEEFKDRRQLSRLEAKGRRSGRWGCRREQRDVAWKRTSASLLVISKLETKKAVPCLGAWRKGGGSRDEKRETRKHTKGNGRRCRWATRCVQTGVGG